MPIDSHLPQADPFSLVPTFKLFFFFLKITEHMWPISSTNVCKSGEFLPLRRLRKDVVQYLPNGHIVQTLRNTREKKMKVKTKNNKIENQSSKTRKRPVLSYCCKFQNVFDFFSREIILRVETRTSESKLVFIDSVNTGYRK